MRGPTFGTASDRDRANAERIFTFNLTHRSLRSLLMEIILLEKITNLGALGDRVKVKPGYARNFLIPKRQSHCSHRSQSGSFRGPPRRAGAHRRRGAGQG
jgi:hypothetical protein